MDAVILEHTDEGVGEAIVLLPGGLTGWQGWAPVLPLLTEGHRVINVQPFTNAQGVAGELGRPGYTAEFERASILATLAATGAPERFHLVGWSNGGRLALDFAIAHGDRVASITAVEPAAWWLVSERQDAREFDTFIRGAFGRDLSEEDVVEFATRVGLAPEGVDLKVHPAWPRWMELRSALTWFGDSAAETVRKGLVDLDAIRCPVLLISGTDTAPWLMEVIAVLADRLPNVTTETWPGGHAALLQHIPAFVDHVTNHVQAAVSS